MTRTDEERRKLQRLIERRSFACYWCKGPIFKANDHSYDAVPDPHGTHVMYVREGTTLGTIELATLSPARLGLTAGMDAYTLHTRNCGRTSRPPWLQPVLDAAQRYGTVLAEPVAIVLADLQVGDVVISLIPDRAIATPFQGPHYVRAIDDGTVRFDRGTFRLGPGTRLRIAREDLGVGLELLANIATIQTIRAAGCRCSPMPTLAWSRQSPCCARCQARPGHEVLIAPASGKQPPVPRRFESLNGWINQHRTQAQIDLIRRRKGL